MAISWTDFDNGDTLGSIRGKINNFNTSATTDVNTNTTNTATNTTDIATNTVAIASNKTLIEEVAIDVVINKSDIASLQSNAPFVPSYTYVHGTSTTVTDDTYEEVARLTTGSVAAGVYKLEQSMLYSLNSTNSSAYFRFSINGGNTWSELRREPKDNTDLINAAYFTNIVHTGGVFEVIIQSRKEAAADILTIASIDISFERKI